MKRYAKFLAALIFVTVGLLTFVSGVSCAVLVGLLTHSGLFGICGPYGEGADFVVFIILVSFPAAVAAGAFSAIFFYRRVR